MFNKLSTKICQSFIKSQSIDEESYELYEYGIFLLIANLFFAMEILLFGAVFRCLFGAVVFYISFRIIRVYAGGYHADTETRCEIITTLIFLAITYFISISNQQNFQVLVFILTAIAIPIIIIFSPLDTPAKPLDDDEKRKYRRISYVILLIIVSVIIIAILFNIKSLFIPCCFSLIVESILLVAGVIKGRLVSGH